MTETFINGRTKYNAPPVGLIFKGPQPETRQHPYREHKFSTTLELDTHHHHLLRSDDNQEVLLGLYSVAYWAEYSSHAQSQHSQNTAAIVSHRRLAPTIANMKPAAIARLVKDSVVDLDRRSYSQALITVSKLLHGRLSLCSTFLAFIDPEKVGIFDDRITAHLANNHASLLEEHTIENALTRPPTETLKEAAARFSVYCDLLGKIKSTINKHAVGWRDSTGCQMARFRTIDVERALLMNSLTNRSVF